MVYRRFFGFAVNCIYHCQVGKARKEVETPPKLCPQSFSFTLVGMKVDRLPPSGLQMALIREHFKEWNEIPRHSYVVCMATKPGVHLKKDGLYCFERILECTESLENKTSLQQ